MFLKNIITLLCLLIASEEATFNKKLRNNYLTFFLTITFTHDFHTHIHAIVNTIIIFISFFTV